MKFTHHPRQGDSPWKFKPEHVYTQASEGMKPYGLWLSVDDDWRRWCEDEQWNVPLTDPIEFEVDTQRCLWLKTAEDIDRFDADYVQKNGGDYRTDWRPLAESHAGLIIAPYIWERRTSMTCSWYYPWDCASGVIWDLSAIKEVTHDRSAAQG